MLCRLWQVKTLMQETTGYLTMDTWTPSISALITSLTQSLSQRRPHSTILFLLMFLFLFMSYSYFCPKIQPAAFSQEPSSLPFNCQCGSQACEKSLSGAFNSVIWRTNLSAGMALRLKWCWFLLYSPVETLCRGFMQNGQRLSINDGQGRGIEVKRGEQIKLKEGTHSAVPPDILSSYWLHWLRMTLSQTTQESRGKSTYVWGEAFIKVGLQNWKLIDCNWNVRNVLLICCFDRIWTRLSSQEIREHQVVQHPFPFRWRSSFVTVVVDSLSGAEEEVL